MRAGGARYEVYKSQEDSKRHVDRDSTGCRPPRIVIIGTSHLQEDGQVLYALTTPHEMFRRFQSVSTTGGVGVNDKDAVGEPTKSAKDSVTVSGATTLATRAIRVDHSTPYYGERTIWLSINLIVT
jgi:hypothetical protein